MERRLGVSAALVDGAVMAGDVTVLDGQIATVGRSPAGRGGLAVPGFVDLQINGFAGVDFTTADRAGFETALAALASHGVTACVATIPTAAPDAYRPALQTIAEVIRHPPTGTAVLGVHLEGPFLNPERAGAHPQRWLRQPDLALADELLGLASGVAPGPTSGAPGGLVLIVTLAPELPGAAALISLARQAGAVVSLGHSNASVEQAHAAFDTGATMVTHLWNAQAPLSARAPGLTGAALARRGVFVGLIADLAHVHADTLRFSLTALGDRAFVVSDAVALAGAEEQTGTREQTRPAELTRSGELTRPASVAGAVGLTGIGEVARRAALSGTAGPTGTESVAPTAELAGKMAASGTGPTDRIRPDGRRERVSGAAVRFEDGALAGSATALDQALRNLVALGVSLPTALATITRTPALALGRRDLGRLRPAGRADVVVLQDDLTIRSVLVAGRDVGS